MGDLPQIFEMLQPELFGLHWDDEYTNCFNHVKKATISYSDWDIVYIFKNREVVLHFSSDRKLCSISAKRVFNN